MNKIFKAINFATFAHKGQVRKGKPDVPYVTHPLAVGIILAKTGADEDTVVAGILHDTIEDCEPQGSITKETIEKEFGADVAKMVDDVTEQDKSLTWAIRKQRAIEHIPQMNHGSLLVKTADQLHNMTDQIEDYRKDGDKLLERFSSSKQDQLERYKKLIPALEKAWPDNPLVGDLKKAFSEIERILS